MPGSCDKLQPTSLRKATFSRTALSIPPRPSCWGVKAHVDVLLAYDLARARPSPASSEYCHCVLGNLVTV